MEDSDNNIGGKKEQFSRCFYYKLLRNFRAVQKNKDIQGVKSVLGNSSNWAEKAVKPMEPMSIFIVFCYS